MQESGCSEQYTFLSLLSEPSVVLDQHMSTDPVKRHH